MGLSNAERQRRYRERKRAEQRNGVTPVTEAVTEPVTRNDVTADGPKLGPRGRRLWEQLTKDGPALKPAERVLAEEACRTADRLDQLDRILRGDEDAWMRFRATNEDGTVVAVVVNNVLSEARQQQVALKALLAELRTSRAGATSGRPAALAGATRRVGAGVDAPAGKEGGGVVADLAAWVANRGAPTAS